MPLPRLILACLALTLAARPALAQDASWRSELYPETWTPATVEKASFETDKLVQDFSYAGYLRGEAPLPRIEGPVFDVTDPAFGADPTGATDSTAAIQKAIDAAAASGGAGGGVVLMPAGVFRVFARSHAALTIRKPHIVLRGAGPEKTFLFNTQTDMRYKAIIQVLGPSGSHWQNNKAPAVAITADLTGPALTIPVADTAPFSVGQYVVVRCDITPEWVLEHKEDAWLGHEAKLGGIAYYRQITALDPQAKTLTLDAPTRYYLKRRDNARVAIAGELVHHVGLEDFSIGNLEHPGKGGFGENDYTKENTPAYQAHGSFAITMNRVRDSWIRNVHSRRHVANATGAHLLSNGVLLTWSRGVTVADCHFQRPQYGGGGGNGYMFRLTSANECLLARCTAEFSRHGFVFSSLSSSGNVLWRCTDRTTARATGDTGSYRTSGASSDHHMHLSHSNLLDHCTADGSFFQAAYRPWGSLPRHNLTAAHTVYWNTLGQGPGGPVVHSVQARFGYIIGTRGSRPDVDVKSSAAPHKTDPVDHVEGVGKGDSLTPASLYEDQFLRRTGRPPAIARP